MLRQSFVVVVCLLGLAFAQDEGSCDVEVSDFFTCMSDVKDKSISHELVKGLVNECFLNADCEGTPDDLRSNRPDPPASHENFRTTFECLREVKKQIKENCEDRLGFDFPDPPEGHHHGPPPPGGRPPPSGGPGRFGPPGMPQGPGRRFGPPPPRGGGGRRGPHGHGAPSGSMFDSMVSQLCPTNGELVKECVNNVTSLASAAREEAHAEKERCKTVLEESGCEESLGSVHEEMCTCVENQAKDNTAIVSALTDCVSGSRLERMMQTDEARARFAGRMCRRHSHHHHHHRD